MSAASATGYPSMLRAITPVKNSRFVSVARNAPTSDSSASTSACDSVRLSNVSQSIERKRGAANPFSDIQSATGGASREECEQRARCGVHPGPERRLRQRRADRRTARLTCEPEAAARRGDLEVGRGRLRERPARAVRRDGHDDETLTLASLTDTLPSVAEEGPLPLGPLPLHARIDEQRGLHDDVRITKERRARLLVLAAHDDAALVRVERDPHESAIRIRFITNERRDAPDRIAFRRLRFHDVRAKVGEDAAALRDRGRGPLVGVHDLDDAKAVEHRLKHRWAL